MNIGDASERSGVSAKMIRYYENVGLLPSVPRRTNGYRDYGDQEVAVLQFVRRTRDLGFSLDEVSTLLALWSDKKRPSREVKRLAEDHIADLERRIREMRAVMKTLRGLAKHCHGDERSECPILDDLATPRKASSPLTKRH
ncbi:MAG: Cu(I)-responsive transcriptional regulator [Proteobacteria bacterium]|nr:Cu(I)-responsive transcriptional regulator [Pseudomonadota bacterium]